MSDIQKARNVLAKWDIDYDFFYAVDTLLMDAARTEMDEPDPGVQMEIIAAQHYAEPIAAAIIAADERMSA